MQCPMQWRLCGWVTIGSMQGRKRVHPSTGAHGSTRWCQAAARPRRWQRRGCASAAPPGRRWLRRPSHPPPHTSPAAPAPAQAPHASWLCPCCSPGNSLCDDSSLKDSLQVVGNLIKNGVSEHQHAGSYFRCTIALGSVTCESISMQAKSTASYRALVYEARASYQADLYKALLIH